MLCLIPIVGGLLIMMGQHDRSEALFYYFRPEDQVPETHLLRLIEKHVSFAFVREKLKDSYSETGRPSIDPELLLRILLIGYLYGITSERKLVEELRMHLAWRWFTGLGFDQEIPHHSTFSKNRHGRFQESKLFEQLFEEIVAHCLEVGLVQGDNLSVDGSFVEANANKESRIPRERLAEAAQVNHTVRQYLVELEQQNPTEEPVHEQEQVSTTDPDSTYATKGGTPARLGEAREMRPTRVTRRKAKSRPTYRTPVRRRTLFRMLKRLDVVAILKQQLREAKANVDGLHHAVRALERLGRTGRRRSGGISAAGRKRIALAQRKRWAKIRAGKK